MVMTYEIWQDKSKATTHVKPIKISLELYYYFFFFIRIVLSLLVFVAEDKLTWSKVKQNVARKTGLLRIDHMSAEAYGGFSPGGGEDWVSQKEPRCTQIKLNLYLNSTTWTPLFLFFTVMRFAPHMKRHMFIFFMKKNKGGFDIYRNNLDFFLLPLCMPL